MARKLKVNMTGVESFTRCPEGEHLVRVKKLEMGTVQGSGDDALKAVFEVLEGDGRGCSVFETFSLGEKALWKLKQFLVAIGVKADGKLSLDLDKLEGKKCLIDVIHEEYNGQKRAKISNYAKPSEDSDEDNEDYDEEDEDEEDEPPKKSAKKTSKKFTKKPIEEDEDDEEEEEEEPAPKAKKGAKKSAPPKATKKSKKKPEPEPEEDEDEDDDWDEDDDE